MLSTPRQPQKSHAHLRCASDEGCHHAGELFGEKLPIALQGRGGFISLRW